MEWVTPRTVRPATCTILCTNTRILTANRTNSSNSSHSITGLKPAPPTYFQSWTNLFQRTCSTSSSFSFLLHYPLSQQPHPLHRQDYNEKYFKDRKQVRLCHKERTYTHKRVMITVQRDTTYFSFLASAILQCRGRKKGINSEYLYIFMYCQDVHYMYLYMYV